MVGEDAEGVLEAHAEQEVRDHVLQEDDRCLEPGEHLHLRIDEELRDALDVLLRGREAAAEEGAEDCRLSFTRHACTRTSMDC